MERRLEAGLGCGLMVDIIALRQCLPPKAGTSGGVNAVSRLQADAPFVEASYLMVMFHFLWPIVQEGVGQRLSSPEEKLGEVIQRRNSSLAKDGRADNSKIDCQKNDLIALS